MEQFRTETIPDTILTEGQPPNLWRFVLDVLETLILSVVLFLAINAVSARIRVDGSSMEPTLYHGEFVIVNKLAYKVSEPKIGDVIVFHFPRDPHQDYIKRIIGLPGDRVTVSQGRVYVNDQPLSEDYLAAPPSYNDTWLVPEGALFVLGDNRNNSSDSHTWGPVPMDYVVGKAIFVYWPPDQWGAIDHQPVANAAP